MNNAAGKPRLRRMGGRWEFLFAPLLYLGPVLLFAWPLPLNLADKVALARGSDFYPHIWNLWWMRFSLLTLGQNPYHTTYLNYPTGQPLLYHVLDPLDGLLSLPLQPLVGLVAAFNLLRLAQLLFAATAMYALCRTLSLPRWAAWAGGALYAFCPLIGTSFDLGQLVEISVGWLPLYILCLIKGLGNRALGIEPGRWGWLVAAGLTLAASALSTWYFFTSLLLFTALYIAWEYVARTKDEGRRTKDDKDKPSATHISRFTFHTFVLRPSSLVVIRSAAVVALALLVLLPLIVALLRESAGGTNYMLTPESTVVKNSADLLSFFVPAPAHIQSMTINPHGSAPALGWTAILLAGVELMVGSGVRRVASSPPVPRSHLLFWLAVAVMFCLLALGPHLLVNGNDTGVPMPYALLGKLPFLGAARVPLRFVILASLAVAVLAAFGLVALARLVRVPAARASLLVAVMALVAVEFLGIPRTLITPSAHPFFSTIAAEGEEGRHEAVLELPYGVRVAPSMFSQTVHRRPITGGYTARRYPYPWLGATPGIANLMGAERLLPGEPDIVSPPVADTALRAFDYYGVRYVALHHLEEGEAYRAGEVLDAIFGAQNIQPVFSDTNLTAYRVPPQAQTGPLVGLGEGWHEREGDGSRVWRWTTGTAMVQVTNPLTQTFSANLQLAAYSLTSPRTMVALYDGREVGRYTINPHPAQLVTLALDLSPGEHWLELRSLEPPDRPPGEKRLISLGFERVAVEGRP